MKLFVVKPFIVKPFVVDPNARHWWWFIAAGVIYIIAVEFLAIAVIGLILGWREEATVALVLFTIVIYVGHGLVAIGRFVRDTQKNQAELTKRLAEQDERIRTLEAQLAALSGPTPTP